MITAIILARTESSRLKNKHLLKIGKYSLLENIYLKLKLNRNISDIYLATGPKKKNLVYENYIKLKKLKIKIFYHEKENNVTERIDKLSNRIKNNHTIVISGDCPAIDNDYINLAYKNIKLKKTDFVKSSKKTLHEGIILFKTNAWSKVQKKSKSFILQENPGYVLRVKKNLFNFSTFKPLKKDTGLNLRLSIDTLSDLQFFRLVNYHSKNDLISYKDTIKFRKYNSINKNIVQKKVQEPKKRTIFIITSANNEIGYGHLARSKILHRQISETYTTDICYVFYKTQINSSLRGYINHEKYLNYEDFVKRNMADCVLIIDLHKDYFDHNLKYFKKYKSIIIDNYSKFKKHINVIPTIKKIINKEYNNIFSGKKYLILSKDLLFENLKKKKKKINHLFLFGSTKSPEKKFLDDITASKIKDYLIILGPYVKKYVIKTLKDKNFKIVVNPKNYYELLCTSKNVTCIYGVSTYEAISIGLKPSIYISKNETIERLKDIKFLKNKNLCKNYDYKDLKHTNNLNSIDLKIPFGGNNILKFI